MKKSQNDKSMMKHHKVILKVAAKGEEFIPALLVKGIKEWPNDYRKRLSEMKEKGWMIKTKTIDRFAVWKITKLGKKIVKSIK